MVLHSFGQQLQILDLETIQRLLIVIKLQHRMYQFHLLRAVTFQIVDEQVEIGEEILADHVRCAIRIDIGQQLDVLLQQQFDLLETTGIHQRQALIQILIDFDLTTKYSTSLWVYY